MYLRQLVDSKKDNTYVIELRLKSGSRARDG